ncbi:serine hydrolase [Stenotrophomonas sp. HMSC10F06]|uniref:serine hydrolase domain-containing protein n=1 Tax=Stenotrophomonas sp. HMSC10F06 TaxID=1581081 RepID=UPI0008A4141D|nr:serine hydrolase domain-containing protein [Stenotrophomonas sp. HMSC10F06]OFS90697.1 serine hydrolase [Stenotrophomonas sp. HMSC10F06]
MLPIRTLMVVLLLFSTSSWARVPTDPAQAEQIFTRWLAAYNAGDRQELQAVLSTYGIDHTAQQYLDIRETFGPFDVLTRTVDTPDTIAAIVRGTSSDRGVLITVAIDPDNRPRLKTLQLEGIEIPDAFKPARLEMPALIAQSRARLDGLQADGKLSGSFLLAKGGEVLMSWQGGLADREQGVAVDAATKFRLASLNKMFTAVGILQLAEAGRLSLDDTVASHLEDYPNQAVATAVTIRQLLNHTSGLGEIFDDAFETRKASLKTLHDYWAVYGDAAPAFKPGTQDQYSNYGYILLGSIIEAASGQPYEDYIEQHIFRVAGMTATGAMPEAARVPGRAIPYTLSDGRWVRETRTLPLRGTSAGGGYSTARDLLRFAEALRAGRLIPAAAVQAATSPQNTKGWYGYGFMVSGEEERRQYGHEGGAPGANAALIVLPSQGYVVIGLSNVDPDAMENVVNFVGNRLPL